MVDAFDQFHIHGFQYSMNREDREKFAYEEIFRGRDVDGGEYRTETEIKNSNSNISNTRGTSSVSDLVKNVD